MRMTVDIEVDKIDTSEIKIKIPNGEEFKIKAERDCLIIEKSNEVITLK